MNRCSISCHSTLDYTVINIFNQSVSPPACLYTSFWFQFLTWSTSPDTGKSSRIYFSIKVLCQHCNTFSHVPSNWYEFIFSSSNPAWNLTNSRWTADLLPLNNLIVWSNIYQTVQCFTTLLQTHTGSIPSAQKKSWDCTGCVHMDTQEEVLHYFNSQTCVCPIHPTES
jgi:hypothetical protein